MGQGSRPSDQMEPGSRESAPRGAWDEGVTANPIDFDMGAMLDLIAAECSREPREPMFITTRGHVDRVRAYHEEHGEWPEWLYANGFWQ